MIYSFSFEVYQVCITNRNVSTLFKLFLFYLVCKTEIGNIVLLRRNQVTLN